MNEIEFVADSVKLSGPRIDGSWSITFTSGEYEKEKLLNIMKLKLNLKVKVSQTP